MQNNDNPTFGGFVKWVAIITAALLVLGVAGNVLGWFGETSQVVREQVGPRALLQKYEWFKNASAALDAKVADISIYETRLKSLADQYKNADGTAIPRNKWARADVESYNQQSAEVAGVKASYNSLAAEYNAQMSKINYAFTNVGQLPAGAEKPLPREYKPYITQ